MRQGGAGWPDPRAAVRVPVLVAWLALASATPGVRANDLHQAAPVPAQAAAKPPTLDLALGDISRYIDPAELAKPLPDELEEIIVRGQRPEPLPEQRVIPQGLGAIVYGVMNPLQSWRMFVPDPNYVIPEKTEDDVREPAGAFRGRILEPGAIYD
jgi:hypothetical protein